MASKQVLVAGAGLVGLCTAYSLAREGHAVTLVDKGRMGSGAARGNGGEITPLQALPMPEPALVTQLAEGVISNRHYFTIAPLALPRLTVFGVQFLRNCTTGRLKRNTAALDQLVRGAMAAFDSFHRDGISLAGGGWGYLNVHSDPEALRVYREAQIERARLLGIEEPGPILSRAELEEPLLREEVTCGYRIPTERYIDPDRFCTELHEALEEMGVNIRPHTELLSLDDTRATVRTGQGVETIGFDKAVVSTGAWLNRQLRGIPGLTFSAVTPGTGYSFHAEMDTLPRTLTMGLHRKTLIVPMSGTARVVGLMDFGFRVERFERHRMDFLREQASQFIHGLDETPISREWTGPRPMTPTGLPYISPVRSHPNIIVATGHNMHGLTLGPVTGEVVSALVSDRDPGIDMRPFALPRF
ncbi:D-amino acid dehydrogenase small subunit [Corynebacterium ciconiae DSM 44920]|uniref:NAD(P)/FAD-dependent oxidoreductase n=1 Tax=Corynebacterium ciconiae TaxID=227319 RepID=UPI0003805BF0|nr:FAD-binding oxidoreductase [Corynebacterium ciconiae]WKD61865.1 D-amino acid dehydrogenase small subunit [Corynebacterium ciconiae DSM 44920]